MKILNPTYSFNVRKMKCFESTFEHWNKKRNETKFVILYPLQISTHKKKRLSQEAIRFTPGIFCRSVKLGELYLNMSSQFVWLSLLPCPHLLDLVLSILPSTHLSLSSWCGPAQHFFGSNSSIHSLWPHHPSRCFLGVLSYEVTSTSSHNELPTTNQSDQLKVYSEIDSWNRMHDWERKGWGRTLQFLQFTQWLTQGPPRVRVLLLSHRVSVATSNCTMMRSVWGRTGWGVIAVLAISSSRIGVIMSWSWHVDLEWSPGTTMTRIKCKLQNSLAVFLHVVPGVLFVQFKSSATLLRGCRNGVWVGIVVWCQLKVWMQDTARKSASIIVAGELNPSH